MKLEYIIEEDNILVKDYLHKIGLSRRLQRHIKAHDSIYINDEKAKNFYKLNKGDKLTIVTFESLNDNFVSGLDDLDVLYEDEFFLIVNKKRGVAIQPSRKHFNDSLFASIKKYYLDHNVDGNIHIVTRLDLDTTGIVLIAKSGYVHSAINNIEYTKKYICECYGAFDSIDGEYTDPIDRVEESSIKRWVKEDGKYSKTIYHVLKNGDISRIECTLVTGRTHQIRVHMAYHNHPLLGDKLYGITDDYDLRLHAYYLSFTNPINNQFIEVMCDASWNK